MLLFDECGSGEVDLLPPPPSSSRRPHPFSSLSYMCVRAGPSSPWNDENTPVPLVSLPPGSSSAPQLADLIFTSTGNVPGCLYLDWQSGPSTAAWDVHWRIMHTGYGLLRVQGEGSGG